MNEHTCTHLCTHSIYMCTCTYARTHLHILYLMLTLTEVRIPGTLCSLSIHM